MAQKCKTGEVYDTKLKKCRRNVRRKNQAMGKSEKKVGKVLTKIIENAKQEPTTITAIKRILKAKKKKNIKGLERYKIYDNMILGKGGYGGKRPVRPKKKK